MMAIGMTYEQYWDGDVRSVKAFLEAEKLRRKRQNEQAYIMGAYIYEALCDVSPLFLDLNKKKKPIPYRKEPFGLSEEKPKADKADKEQLEENERLKAELFFKNWARAAGAKFKKRDDGMSAKSEE